MNGKWDDLIHDIAVLGHVSGKLHQGEESEVLEKLLNTGSRLWMDTGDRDLALSLWKKEISALTTNNTLANQVVQSGVMDADIESALKRIRKEAPDISEEELITEIGFIINCKIALRLVTTFGKKVSVELHPSMSRDIEKSLHYARRYYKVNPEHFIIKVPLTPEGYLVVRRLSKEGIPTNFTLGFSARQNYLAARLANPTYVNVFLGRLNAVVSDNGLGSGDYVGERVTIATQRVLNGLKKRNPKVGTSLIAASVRNGQQVLDLAGVDVLTIPPKSFGELYNSETSSGKISSKLEEVCPAGIDSPDRFAPLWEVDERFVSFVDTLLGENPDSMNGEGLLKVCRESNINLFYPFSSEEIQSIKDRGKIPRLSDWNEDVAIDDLMTASALLSFTTDQAALDKRIKGFI
ncbi:MAG: transaldolase family protein [Nitrospinae bacterium]|nr:transaldolase family protein [Nitrospinota bacterium]